MAFHRFIRDAMDFDKFLVNPVNEVAVEVKYIRNAAGHASSKIVTGVSQNCNYTAGHVLTAMVANTLDNSVGARVAYRETLPGESRGEQLATGCTVETGVADDGCIL